MKKERRKLDGNSFLLVITIALFLVMYVVGCILFKTQGFAKTQNFLNLFISNAGLIVIAVGMTIVMKSDSGVGPNDLVAIVISDKLGRSFSITRIVVDVCFVAAGFLMGGAVGIGTIICAALVGPVAGIFLPHSEKIVERIIASANVQNT